MIEERNQLKSELCELQGERDRLFDEKVQLKGCVQELTSQGRQLMAELERTRTRFVKMEALACNLKEHADGVNGKVSWEWLGGMEVWLEGMEVWLEGTWSGLGAWRCGLRAHGSG